MASLVEKSITYSANGEKKLAYLSAGPADGPLMIFLHGWPAIAKTWKPQLQAFAAKGYHVVAPDMPGYGNSTANKVFEDYSHEVINVGLLALLKETGRDKAVWFGHDWGAGVLSTLASVHPEIFIAAVFLAVPCHVIEYGIEELFKHINRDIYPEDQYKWGPWSYQVFYENEFEKATNFFDKDIPGVLRAIYGKGNPDSFGKPAVTSHVMEDGGWFGGVPEPPKAFHQIPDEAMCIDQETYKELVAAMEKTTFWPADAYYMNHARNRAYNEKKAVNGGTLEFPVLFVEAKYDGVCDTAVSTLADPMKKACKNLTYVTIEAGHWVAEEKPEETNAAIAKFLQEKVNLP